MDLKQLQVFVSIANSLNFTKAADELFITQSSVSKIMKSLEDELGTQLLNRYPKTELTEIGAAIYKQSLNILTLIESIPLEVASYQGLTKGEIKIGIPPLTGSAYFPRIIGEFNTKYPNVEIQLFESGSKQIEKKLDEGLLDLGIMVLNPLKSSIYNSIEYVKDPLLAVINTKSKLATNEVIRFEELRNEKFVLFQDDFKLNDSIINRCHHNNFEPYIVCKSSQKEFIAQMVSEGIGIAFLPEVTCHEIQKKNLVFIPLEEPKIYLNLSIVWRRDRYLKHASKEWIRFATSKFDID